MGLGWSKETELRDEHGKILKKNHNKDESKGVRASQVRFSEANFASTCDRIKMNFVRTDLKALDLFLKRTIKGKQYADIMSEMNVFEIEAIFFNEIVPPLQEFCEIMGAKYILLGVIPKCYHADMHTILMEDLGVKGYQMSDKKDGHTKAQAAMVMRLLGKFHGATYAYIQDMGEAIFLKQHPKTAVSNSWSQVSDKLSSPIIDFAVRSCIKTLERFPVPGSAEVLTFVEPYRDQGYQKLCKYFEVGNKSCCNVLNHGDVWNCNLLFDEKDGEGKAILIDFHTIHVGSPVLDLQYYFFLRGNVNVQVLQNEVFDLLKVYYNQFKETVQALGDQVKFPFGELVNEFRKKCVPTFILGLYLQFGWDALENIGNAKEIKDSVGQDYTTAMSRQVDKLLDASGEYFAKQIVDDFKSFKKITSQRICHMPYSWGGY